MSSPSQARSGEPNVTVQRIGIGTNSPFGMTRVDQHSAEHTLADETAHGADGPVVRTRDWPGHAAKGRWQHGPDQHKIAVDIVVREIHAGPRVRRDSQPFMKCCLGT